jgi:hypothetical protein
MGLRVTPGGCMERRPVSGCQFPDRRYGDLEVCRVLGEQVALEQKLGGSLVGFALE